METVRPTVQNWSIMVEVVSLLLPTIKQFDSLLVHLPVGPEPFSDAWVRPTVWTSKDGKLTCIPDGILHVTRHGTQGGSDRAGLCGVFGPSRDGQEEQALHQGSPPTGSPPVGPGKIRDKP